MLYILVPSVSYEPLQDKGALQSVSPEEIRAAFLLAIARDVAAGAPESVVRKWVKLSLSCTATFVLDATPPHKYSRARQFRENLAADNDAMTRTALQKVYEVAHFRDKHTLSLRAPQLSRPPTQWSRRPKDVNL